MQKGLTACRYFKSSWYLSSSAVLLSLVNRYIPMAGSIKSILNAVVVIAVVLWLLNIFGLMHYLSSIHLGKV
jgi:hypothetical protein